jgi:hypothetical protein
MNITATIDKNGNVYLLKKLRQKLGLIKPGKAKLKVINGSLHITFSKEMFSK